MVPGTTNTRFVPMSAKRPTVRKILSVLLDYQVDELENSSFVQAVSLSAPLHGMSSGGCHSSRKSIEHVA